MKPDVVLKNLEKLFAKRKALDKQIEDTEKKLVSAAKNAVKAAPKAAKGKGPVKKAPAKKASGGGKRGRKPKASSALSIE